MLVTNCAAAGHGKLTDLILSLTLGDIAELLQGFGLPAEIVTRPDGGGVVNSANGEIAFGVFPGNVNDGRFVDFTFSCSFTVDVPGLESLPDRWNSQKRFCRLYLRDKLMVFEMDVVAVGGVSHDHLKAMTEIWNRLLVELLVFLRNTGAPVS
jgi:hypothetical protein